MLNLGSSPLTQETYGGRLVTNYLIVQLNSRLTYVLEKRRNQQKMGWWLHWDQNCFTFTINVFFYHHIFFVFDTSENFSRLRKLSILTVLFSGDGKLLTFSPSQLKPLNHLRKHNREQVKHIYKSISFFKFFIIVFHSTKSSDWFHHLPSRIIHVATHPSYLCFLISVIPFLRLPSRSEGFRLWSGSGYVWVSLFLCSLPRLYIFYNYHSSSPLPNLSSTIIRGRNLSVD